MRKRARTWLVCGLLVLVAAFAAIRRFGVGDPSQRYLTAVAKRADLENSVRASGTLQAFLQVSVGAQVCGQIKRLHVKLGDAVQQGDAIAEIDSLPQQNAQRTAEAGVRNTRAQLAAQRATLVPKRNPGSSGNASCWTPTPGPVPTSTSPPPRATPPAPASPRSCSRPWQWTAPGST